MWTLAAAAAVEKVRRIISSQAYINCIGCLSPGVQLHSNALHRIASHRIASHRIASHLYLNIPFHRIKFAIRLSLHIASHPSESSSSCHLKSSCNPTQMGGPAINWRPGRKDATEPTKQPDGTYCKHVLIIDTITRAFLYRALTLRLYCASILAPKSWRVLLSVAIPRSLFLCFYLPLLLPV
jgi:hypothetical protein